MSNAPISKYPEAFLSQARMWFGCELIRDVDDFGHVKHYLDPSSHSPVVQELVKARQSMSQADIPMNGLSVACFGAGAYTLYHFEKIVQYSQNAARVMAQYRSKNMTKHITEEVIELSPLPHQGIYLLFQDTMVRQTLLLPPVSQWQLLRDDIPRGLHDRYSDALIAQSRGQSNVPPKIPSELHWHEGIAGMANIVTYNGEDICGVAHVADAAVRARLIEKHNRAVDQLLEKISWTKTNSN